MKDIVFGTVTANRGHFESGIEHMQAIDARLRSWRPTTRDHDLQIFHLFAAYPERIVERCQHHHRCAVLVIVRDWDVQVLSEPRLDIEAARIRNVLPLTDHRSALV